MGDPDPHQDGQRPTTVRVRGEIAIADEEAPQLVEMLADLNRLHH
jgi:hypothetical protein